MTSQELSSKFIKHILSGLPKKPTNAKEQKLRDQRQIFNCLSLMILMLIVLAMDLFIKHKYANNSVAWFILVFLAADFLYLVKLISKYIK